MKTFTLALTWIALCLLQIYGVRAEEFSWKSFLGQPTLALETSMAGLAKCKSTTYRRDFPVSLDVIYNADDLYNALTKERSVVIDVNAPVVAISVNYIGILKCHMKGANVGILAHSIGGEVFRIELMYGDCSDEMRCVRREWNRTAVDDVIYGAVKTQIVDAHSDEFIALHYEDLQSRHMRSLFEGLRCYSDNFSVGQIPSSEFRCMVAASVEAGILSGTSLVELRNAGFLGMITAVQ